MKGILNKVKKQALDLEKIFLIYITDKEFISTIYKESLQIIKKAILSQKANVYEKEILGKEMLSIN